MNILVTVLLIICLVIISILGWDLYQKQKKVNVTKYTDIIDNVCERGININIKKGSLGKVPVVGSMPQKDMSVSVNVPCN